MRSSRRRFKPQPPELPRLRIEMPDQERLIAAINDEDISWVCSLMKLLPLDEPRRSFLKNQATLDVSACPGSGKTTLVVAKLAMLARTWKSPTRGICVLSHTNVAREEIINCLGGTVIGQTLLSYPHFIDTIHGFVNRYLAVPWLVSNNFKIAAIDNDIAAGIRRRHLGSTDHRRLKFYLNQRSREVEDIRLLSTDLTVGVGDQPFPAGQGTEMYRLAHSAVSASIAQGYFCHEEMFVFANALLTKHPPLSSILSMRFPFVMIDEMQDTSSQQNVLLERIFQRDSPSIAVQRVGDANQAIFDGASGQAVANFPNPEPGRTLSISNSFRFGDSIAKAASPFAIHPVQPAGLRGIRPCPPDYIEPKPTILLFPDGDTSAVLNAFGKYLIDSLWRPVAGQCSDRNWMCSQGSPGHRT